MPLLLFLFFMAVIYPASAAELTGRVQVLDGDTLSINGTEIELWGLDAPELEQQCFTEGKPWFCGQSAKHHIEVFTQGKTVFCKAKPNTDGAQNQYKCAVGSLDIGAEMIEVGLALPYPPVSDTYYIRSYKEARGLGRGIHAGTFIVPWEWRKARSDN